MSSEYGSFYELEDKKRKISQAAVELFAKKSFSQTTVKEFTIQAGVGKGTFYNYFDSKVSLL
ncbi:MAG: TetR/AcrR family transcriptional regulator [Halanaerobiales bacterium]|nr:TetR/AcrR family transcriptional regulator [Halanaerobiales bacterium]